MADEGRRAIAAVEPHGTYLEFVSELGFDFIFESLEDLRSGIRLRNVSRTGEPETIVARLYVPNEKRGRLLRKLTDYAQNETRSGKPKNQRLVEGISDIRLCVLESFWRDELSLLPGPDPVPVEVWVTNDDEDALARLDAVLGAVRIERLPETIVFPERSVVLVSANRDQLQGLVELSDDIAELRRNKETAAFYVALDNREQVEHARALLARTAVDTRTNVAVCVLDTGVNRGHMLLEAVVVEADLHTVDQAWGVADQDGHGTLMAGVAVYGDLLEALAVRGPVRLSHVVESAKILSPKHGNPAHLWGYITAQGLFRAEAQRPDRQRVACLAVTSVESRDRGRPSSWSGVLDQVLSGYDDDRRRLMIVSAGNVTEPSSWLRYPDDNLTNEVHDPAQAWNALTVGASTDKVLIKDATLAGYKSVAPAGGLSPYSTTSVTWDRKWPIKPEVVCEGGNVAVGPNNSILEAVDLQLLSTYHLPQTAVFGDFAATSAAAAKVAWMAARIQAFYPEAWPETVRGLVVHSARWTETLKRQFLRGDRRTDYADLLRVCGYGVPDLSRALYCAANSLTLVSQAELQPYDRSGSSCRTNEMHVYSLPWPTEVLRGLGAVTVEMRVTLSYFVEPSPGEVGWDRRYRYPSHGLRFALNGPGETQAEFLAHVNRQAREDGEPPGTEGPGKRWLIGSQVRDVGSIHSDVWRGTAADLSQSHVVAIYPTTGWWKGRAHLGRCDRRCRYSLIVSIETPPSVGEIDIYTPVAVQTGIAVPIVVVAT